MSLELGVQLQKYLMDGRMIWAGNASVESAWADRGHIDNLPPGFDWPTIPEMEIEPTLSTGVTYRFAPAWFIGLETQYQEEYETQVNRERWSWFVGPSLHYGGRLFSVTLTWLEQLRGGGQKWEGQTEDLHLVEKTKHEVKLQLEYDF